MTLSTCFYVLPIFYCFPTRGVQTQSLRAPVQPGFVSYQAENTFSKSSETVGKMWLTGGTENPVGSLWSRSSAMEQYRMGCLADFVILVQASLVRSLEIEESAETIQWFPALLYKKFPLSSDWHGWIKITRRTEISCTILFGVFCIPSQELWPEIFFSRLLSSLFWPHLANCLHVSSPIFLQRHHSTRTLRPRKINLSTSDVRYTSITSGPALVVTQRRDFRRRKPSVVVARESNLRWMKTQTLAGKTRAAVIWLFSLGCIKLYANVKSCREHEEIPMKHKNVPLRQ